MSIEKRCARCKENLPLELFRPRADQLGNHHSYCIPCDRAASRDHYNNNKDYYLEKNRRRKKELQCWLQKYKSNHPCQYCGESRHYVLVFHHRDASEKDADIAKMLSNSVSVDRMLDEISKCDVLCANCHRALHWKERGDRGLNG